MVIVGGGLVGCELALWLKQQDASREVTIVEALPGLMTVGAPSCTANGDMLRALLPFHGVNLQLGTRVKKTQKDGVLLTMPDGSEASLPADQIILAMGYRSDNRLYNEIRDLDAELYLVGDAGKVANIHYAIWNAYEVARGI